MPEAQTLRDLIARVEMAEGPDRKLDAEIALATGWRLKTVDGVGYWRRGDYSWTAEMEGVPPFYTASLDAAVSLVPSGWVWGASSRGYARAWTITDEGKALQKAECHHAATPALALTAAALRARLAEMEARDE